MSMRVLSLLVLAPCAVSGAAVMEGINTCLDKEHVDYSCSLSPGSLTIDMTGCELLDSEFADMDACIEAEGLKDLPITFIKLGQNEFTTLPEDFFQPFATSLQHLHLEENNLYLLPPHIFSGLSSLIKLHLQTNDLVALPSGLFDDLVKMEDVDLASNPNLGCVPSTTGTMVQPGHLHLPEGFSAGDGCACLPGGCAFDCAPGAEGYVCSGGPTPSPTPAPTPSPTTSPTPAPTPSPSPAPVDSNGNPSTNDNPSSTQAPVTPSPTAAITDSPISENMCKNGIEGLQVGDACCSPKCDKCGGVDCSQLAAAKGLTAEDCCVNTILADGVECGDGVKAPCINYDTPAPTPVPGSTPFPTTPSPETPFALTCSMDDVETACKSDSACRQCMYVTTIEQEDAWKDCFEGYTVDAQDPCSSPTAMTCCLVAIGENCLTNSLFMAYAECFIEEESGGAGCSTPPSCDETQLASTTGEGNAAGRLASPLHGVVSFVMGVILALVGAVFAQ